MKILVIEDEERLINNIAEALQADNMQVDRAYDGQIAERLMKKESYDCVIMDINLPKKNGYDLCREFRRFNDHTPVLMLTAFDELEDKIQGFDSGADDYLTKPFFMKELILRVKSLVKRSLKAGSNRSNERLVVSDIVIDTSTKQVSRQGQLITLTPREYQILLKLCENPGEIISKNSLLQEIWGTSLDINSNTVEVYINFLRKKIDKPFGKSSIKTKIGFGYYLDPV